jgi:hypothetical protein
VTLILSFLSSEFAVQVADRQVTLQNGRIVNDTTTKMIVFDGCSLFGYTGFAVLNGQPTHRWMTNALHDVLANGQTLDQFAEQLDVALAATPIVGATKRDERGIKRIALAGVGFARDDAKSPFLPIYGFVSNFRGAQGEWLAEALPRCSVVYARDFPRGHPYVLLHAGVGLTVSERRSLFRAVARCVRQGTGPQPIIRVLIDQVRAVSTRRKDVGKSLLVASLPVSKVPVGISLQAYGPPDYMEPTYLYVPAGEADGRFFGPNFATRDTAVCDPLVLSGEAAESFDPTVWPTK